MSSRTTTRSGRERRLKVMLRALPDGQAEEPMVFCAREGADVPLLFCSKCDHCGGLVVDASERGTFLRCRAEPDPIPRQREVPRVERGEGARGTTPIGELMTRAVRTVSPETSVENLVEILLGSGISAVPVVDADGRAVGIASKTDLLRRYHGDAGAAEAVPATLHTRDGVELEFEQGFHTLGTGELSVAEVMTPRVLNLPEDATVGHAAAVMSFEGVHRLVVNTRDGQVAGILSALDILRWLACETGFIVPEVGRLRNGASS